MKPIITTIFLFISFTCSSQDLSRLWVVGSAVPEGRQELTAFPGKLFKFAGSLYEGTLQIRNTPDHTSSTYYLRPQNEDAYIVCHGITFVPTRDANAEWTVPLSEDRYRFTVDLNTRKLTGELFTPWNELFIVGGATDIGWESYIMLPFSRVEGEICTWEWTGQLRKHPQFGEPDRFKINGQNAWAPKVLHPFVNGEDVLESTFLLTGTEPDNKWKLSNEGKYHIRVDVFRERISAEMVK